MANNKIAKYEPKTALNLYTSKVDSLVGEKTFKAYATVTAKCLGDDDNNKKIVARNLYRLSLYKETLKNNEFKGINDFAEKMFDMAKGICSERMAVGEFIGDGFISEFAERDENGNVVFDWAYCQIAEFCRGIPQKSRTKEAVANLIKELEIKHEMSAGEIRKLVTAWKNNTVAGEAKEADAKAEEAEATEAEAEAEAEAEEATKQFKISIETADGTTVARFKMNAKDEKEILLNIQVFSGAKISVEE